MNDRKGKNIAWKLWLLAGVMFLLAGMILIFDKKNNMTFMYIGLGVFYLLISAMNYKLKDKPNEIILSDEELKNMTTELTELIKEGKKIKVIKRYRIITGLGLKEAKEYVDSLSENM